MKLFIKPFETKKRKMWEKEVALTGEAFVLFDLSRVTTSGLQENKYMVVFKNTKGEKIK